MRWPRLTETVGQPSSLFPVPCLGRSSFPRFGHPVTAAVLTNTSFVVTACSDGVVLVWDCLPKCYRLTHPCGAVLCAYRGSYDAKHVMLSPSWTDRPADSGPRVAAVLTADQLLSSDGTALALAANVPTGADRATRWLQQQATIHGHPAAVVSQLCAYSMNATATRSPVTVSSQGAEAARTLSAVPGCSSTGYAYLMDDLTVAWMPAACATSPRGFDHRMVTLCDPSLFEAAVAVDCVGSAGSATADSSGQATANVALAPHFAALHHVYTHRARVLRVAYVAVGRGMAVDDVMPVLRSNTATHPSNGAPVSALVGPVAAVRRCLLAQFEAVVSQRQPRSGSAFVDGKDAFTIDLVCFTRPADSCDEWLPLDASGSAPALLSTPTVAPAHAHWVAGVVVTVSADRSHASVALNHMDEVVEVSVDALALHNGDAVSRTDIKATDDVLVHVDHKWYRSAVAFVTIVVADCEPAVRRGVDALVAAAPRRRPDASLTSSSTNRKPATDMICATVVVSTAGGNVTSVCGVTVGRAAVEVPALELASPLSNRVRL